MGYKTAKWIGLALIMLLTMMATARAAPLASPWQMPDQESSPPAQTDEVMLIVLGRVTNTQGCGVSEAKVQLFLGEELQQLQGWDGERCVAERTGQEGQFRLTARLSRETAEAIIKGQLPLIVEVSAPAFRPTRLRLRSSEIVHSDDHFFADAGTVLLPRAFNAAFFITIATFVVVFGLIALRVVHETLAALAGATLLLAVTYILGTGMPDLWVISFERAVHHIDFDVVFLVLALMIFVAITARTGLFPWLAFSAYRLSGGRPWRLAVALTLITAVTSAFLNNVTIMLLIAPVTVQIALALDLDPLAFLLPEVLASNIGGTATLIGDPPNALIGSYAHLGFGPFLSNLAPVVLLITCAFVGMMWWLFGSEYRRETAKVSPAQLAQLAKEGRITDPALLRKVILVAALTMLLFFVGDVFHMPPSVAALIGATTLLLWARPSVTEMIAEVDWTTLVFFMALFILVGALQEVGVIQLIAEGVARLAGSHLTLAILLTVWVPAIGSALIANIPFAAAMLPVTAHLTRTVTGASNAVLYWALALGTDLGGNATLIGAAANIVTAGIAERAGYRLSFRDFARVGVPVTVMSLLISTAYLLVRY